jgi:hypothetical protein
MLSVVDVMDDPALFAPWFSGPSWDVWRAVLKAAFALPMDDAERRLFACVAERDPPRKRVRELWAVASRRAGKDSIASLIATHFAAFESYEHRLRPGEAAHVMALAVDRNQAKVLLGYSRAFFERLPMLGSLVKRETADGLELTTGAELLIQTANFRSVRGRSIAFACLDECAFWRSDESASPDTETYVALRPGMATLPSSMLVGISSPYRRGGLLYEKWKEHYGQPDDDVLVVRGASRAFNPTLDQWIVDDAMARDPQAARAEWLGEWRDDIATYVQRDLIEAAVDDGVVVRPPVRGYFYSAFCDPSGGVSDAFTCAIAHEEGGRIVLDCLVEIGSPFNPTDATASIAATLKAYGLTSVVGDKYAASWTLDAFGRQGIEYVHSERDRSAIYSDALPLFTSGRARLLDHKRLVSQFAQLERKTTSVGRDKIDHPNGLHDDLSNAVAGAMVEASLGDDDLRTYLRAFGPNRNWAWNPLRPIPLMGV